MKQHYEVVVIGGGIIGCSIAYHLAKEKVDVGLFERERIGTKTTSAAAGMLGAHSESNGEDTIFSFARSSQQAYNGLKDELYTLSGIDIGYREGGILKLVFSDADKYRLTSLLKQPTVKWLDKEEVKKMEPMISPNVLGAAYIMDDMSVMPVQTCESFANSARILGASIFENNDVYKVEEKGDNYLVRTTKGDVEASYVVFATGVYGNGLFKQIGLDEELVPVKGESLIVHNEKHALKHTLFHESCYIVPRTNGKLVIGATMIENDWGDSVSLDGIKVLIEKAKSMLPSAIEWKIDHVKAGLRPSTFDGNPFIGSHPEKEKILVACGHYRNGILLAPATGKMICDFILGKKMNREWVEAFRVDRRQSMVI